MFEENPAIPSHPVQNRPVQEGPDQAGLAADHDDDTMVFYPPPKVDLEPLDFDPVLPGPDFECRRTHDSG